MDLTLTAIVMSHVSSDVSCTLASFEVDLIDIPALLTSLRIKYQRPGSDWGTVQLAHQCVRMSLQPYSPKLASLPLC